MFHFAVDQNLPGKHRRVFSSFTFILRRVFTSQQPAQKKKKNKESRQNDSGRKKDLNIWLCFKPAAPFSCPVKRGFFLCPILFFFSRMWSGYIGCVFSPLLLAVRLLLLLLHSCYAWGIQLHILLVHKCIHESGHTPCLRKRERKKLATHMSQNRSGLFLTFSPPVYAQKIISRNGAFHTRVF